MLREAGRWKIEMGNVGVRTSVPIQNKLSFSTAAFGNLAPFPGFFEKPKNHVPSADVTTLNMNSQPDTKSILLYQTGVERE